MEDDKVLKLDFNTKCIYFVIHLFGPILIFSFLAALFCGISKTFPFYLLVFGLGIGLGLYYAMKGINEYKKYVVLSGNTLLICKDHEKTLTVMEKYNIEEINQFIKSENGIDIEINDKTITILNLQPYKFCLFLLAGLLILPVKERTEKISQMFLDELNNYKLSADEVEIKKVGMVNSSACWVANAIIIGVSAIFILIYSLLGLLSGLKGLISLTESLTSTEQSIASSMTERIKTYDKYIKENPDNPDLYYVRGLSKNILRKFDEAIADYDKAIELNPKYVKAYVDRGTAKRHLNDYTGAEKDYQKALELDPNNYGAYVYFGALKHEQKDYEASEKYLNKAIELDPDNEHAYFYKWLLHEDYKTEEKDEIYKKYNELKEKNKSKSS